MTKRNLFTELEEGFGALQQEREGKLTLRSHTLEAQPKVVLSASEIATIREKLNMSQAVFAATLRVEKRTLERWEQDTGTSGANAMLIKMVGQYPDTIERVSAL